MADIPTDLVSDETLRAWLKGAEEHIESGVATDMVAVCPLALRRACREIEQLRGLLRGIATCGQFKACDLCRDLIAPYKRPTS